MDKVQSRGKRLMTHGIFLFCIILLACLYIYPVFLMVNNSLKPFKEILTNVLALPTQLEWANYTYVIEKMEYFRLFWNNVAITLIGIAGIVLFSLVVLFQLITLPVEFNASSRALLMLETDGYLRREEIGGAKAVLQAAALTYVAGALSSVLQLLRLVLISNRRRR